MDPNQFLTLLACLLCLGLSTIVVKQASLDAEHSPTFQTVETTPTPSATTEPVRL